ncbi:streptophobe family protein [Streptomyces sp. NBC_01724]|uniref:streptophobe family protein n=1 Tax=unclassified Streptomyces TaxID=2593676 RepID=UPI002E2F01E2|nr:streptophobe family protein [Streptomyces sp. NBC_01724]WTE50003.1 streptophobe family protein [Streptomyces sp. NBC_01620]WTE58088.1 streptophobe family protein [Streptomyces sp. NBC_01617]
MSQQASSDRSRAPRPAHGWGHALLTVLAGLVVMVATAALGLWAAGAAGLPGSAFPRVVAAVVVMAAGGSVELSGNAGDLARTHAEFSVLPLSVTLAGALVIAAGFLRPLRHRAVAGTRELAGWAARVAVLWALVLIGLSVLARATFDIPVRDATDAAVADLLGVSPKVGFRTDIPLTLVLGLIWLAGILVLALLVSRSAPLPGRLVRFQESVRPAAYAMVALLLGYVVVGLVVALVVMAVRGHPADTFAVILLGLPNLVWLAYTLGLGASWEGKVDGPFGLPMPQMLDSVLRTPDISTVNVSTLAEHDGRAWWLVVAAAVLTVAAAFLMAVRSPARIRPWQHAVHMAVALVLTVLTICLVARVSAHYGVSLLGIGDLGGGLGGELTLRPRLWSALAVAALWGLVTGFLGGLLASRVDRRGEVPTDG